MLRAIFLTAVTLLVAVGGGAASVWYALDHVGGLGALEIGAWTAYPATGTAGVDPYSRARASRGAELPLGPSEGLEFTAGRDDGGEPLRRECDYVVEGPSPAARFFTLHAEDAAGRPIRRAAWRPRSGEARPRPPALHSHEVLREADGRVVVAVSGMPRPGNWLYAGGSGPMTLVLALYDTPVASSARVGEVGLPAIRRVGCPS
ncbi:MAG: DUF1214 domain-containing protein [Rhizobiaceae bacterium]|nr:DUF1214 domain-containing protein [Rhizobiaceae bacterium]MCV0405509.1 DUF1214 domain-containing protein [Rhizobiaceae bacterium]